MRPTTSHSSLELSWHQWPDNVDPNGYLVLLDGVIKFHREGKEYCQNILSALSAMWKTWHLPLLFFILKALQTYAEEVFQLPEHSNTI